MSEMKGGRYNVVLNGTVAIVYGPDGRPVPWKEVDDLLNAARPEARTQEPAAWLEITDDGDIIGASLFRDKEELPKGWRWEPVYRRLAMNSGRD